MKLSQAVVEIIGLGQMGSSLAKAIVDKSLSKEVIGFARRSEVAKRAVKQKIVHKAFSDPEKIFKQKADIVILAVPVQAALELVRSIPSSLSSTLFMDIASTKKEILDAVKAGNRQLNYVSGHPMTGTEKTGIQACNPGLFAGKPFILVQPGKLDAHMSNWVGELVKGIGAFPVYVKDAADHDLAVGVLSHLPYLLAYSLIHVASQVSRKKLAEYPPSFLWNLAGPSFRDATRVALSDPDIALDFLWSNRHNLIRILKLFSRNCSLLETWLGKSQKKEFQNWIRQAYDRKHKQ